MTATFETRIENRHGRERGTGGFDLAGIRDLLGALGNPERGFRAVHVAGTNGKGSVAALIERVLREAGHRTGLYTSPHLVDFRERIRVRGRWVDQAWLESELERIERLPRSEERTFFEVATALAFSWFATREVAVAVVEVGLGGRLDATNVITPEVSVITSVERDHTEILGESIEQIAAEKAGIVKPGVPVVENVAWTSARQVIREIAAERGSAVVAAGERATVQATADPRILRCATRCWGTIDLDLEDLPPFHHLNLGTALATLDVLAEGGLGIPEPALRAGIARARWPGRLERCPAEPRLWWDGAHNPAGVEALGRVWRFTGLERPSTIVLAVSRDKEIDRILATLDRLFRGARLIATRSSSERAMEPERIAAVARGLEREGLPRGGGWSTEVEPDVPTACRRAIESASPRRPALALGSLFAVGEAMRAFGGAPAEVQ